MRMDIDDDMKERGGFGQPTAPVKPEQAKAPRYPRTVLVLHFELKISMEHSKQDVLRVHRALGKIKRQAVLHGDRQCGFVLQTHFTAAQIMEVIRPVTIDSAIANAWVWTPGADISSAMPFDPLVDRVLEAWSDVRDWNKTLGRLPPTVFAASRPMQDGRGEVATRILDHHPLNSPGDRH